MYAMVIPAAMILSGVIVLMIRTYEKRKIRVWIAWQLFSRGWITAHKWQKMSRK